MKVTDIPSCTWKLHFLYSIETYDLLWLICIDCTEPWSAPLRTVFHDSLLDSFFSLNSLCSFFKITWSWVWIYFWLAHSLLLPMPSSWLFNFKIWSCECYNLIFFLGMQSSFPLFCMSLSCWSWFLYLYRQSWCSSRVASRLRSVYGGTGTFTLLSSLVHRHSMSLHLTFRYSVNFS